MKTKQLIILSVIIIFTMVSCSEKDALEANIIHGFWSGLWHGIIAPVTFILKLIDSDFIFYSCNNNGGWYNLGFLLGTGTTVASSSTK